MKGSVLAAMKSERAKKNRPPGPVFRISVS
jgi:hypothetical protein